VFCNHVTIIPAIRAILDSPDMRIDGFVGPGHVSTVIGCRPYEWIADQRAQAHRRLRLRAAGHPAIHRDALRQLRDGQADRGESVQARGPVGRQSAALRAMAKSSSCARTSNGAVWDSFRNPRCAFATRTAEWDSEYRFTVPGVRVTDPKAAQCGEVLKGVLKPSQCKLFGKECTPEHPVGALMVSSEGSCAAYFNYEHRKNFGTSSTHRREARDNPMATIPKSGFASRKLRWLTARAERPAAAWWKAYSLRCYSPVTKVR
jgi:hydrogenase expression/formation protein HypD